MEAFEPDESGVPRGRLLPEEDAEEYLGLPFGTLKDRRKRARAPVHVKIGAAVYYTKADLEEWVEASKVRRTAAPDQSQQGHVTG